MPRGDLLRMRRNVARRLAESEKRPTRFRARIGDGAGNIVVTGKRNYIYIRRLGRSRAEECLNTRVPRRNNLKIIVGYTSEQPGVLQVLEPDWGGMAQPDVYHYSPYHHEAHEFGNAAGGDDVTWIQSQQFVPLLVYPTDPISMLVNVYGGWYPWATNWHYFDLTVSADLTGSIPAVAGRSVYVLISIDGATEALQYTTGADFPTALPPADREDMIPAAPSGSIPLAAIFLTNGMTDIDWEEIYDLRLMTQPVGSSVSPPCDDWVGLNAAGAASWQPDSVAVLHNGQITEYADPDDAFTAAVAGDVVLVPDGTWTLSASHAIASIDVAGIAGTRDGCILQATADVGATLLTIDDGEISDVTVTYSTDNAAARTALKLDATTAASYAFNVRAECENDTGDAIGLWIDSSYAFNCLVEGTCNGANNAIGTYIYNGVLERSRSYAYNNGAGHAYGVEVDTAGYARWSYLHGSAGAGNGYGIYLQGSANAWAYHCELVGSDFDIGILALATLYVYSDIYDTVSNLGTLTHVEGDRAGKARNETITGQWTFDAVSPATTHEVTDAANAAATEVLRLLHNLSAGAAAAGFGARQLTRLEDAGGAEEDAVAVEDSWSDPAAVSEDSYRRWLMRVGGAALAEVARLDSVAFKSAGGLAPTLGSTTEAEKWGHAYLGLTQDVYPDGETDPGAGLWRRFINIPGLGNYIHHRGAGVGIPAGCTQTTTPANLWAPWLAGYIGWFSGTYYAQYPNHATLPAGLTVHTANPIADDKILDARILTTGSSNFGVWADNYEVTRNYAIGEYIYRFDAYAYGNGPETLLYTQVATSICTVGGIGAAATFAAWVNHANTGPYGPFGPSGNGITLRLIINLAATPGLAVGYVMGEQGARSSFGNYILYDDAWPGTSVYNARRAGFLHRGQGAGWACWDWYDLP